jgi:predicted nucleotidyltransferase
VYFDRPFSGLIPGASGAVLSVLLRTGQPLTGRQIHRLVADRVSRASVQVALKHLADVGLVTTTPVGRAGLHTINERHVLVRPLRDMADPLAALAEVVRGAVDDRVQAVLLFGSLARGEATADSDIDLAVIADEEWDGRGALQAAVEAGCGSPCDVLVSGAAALAAEAAAVTADIMRDGIALVGVKPDRRRRTT